MGKRALDESSPPGGVGSADFHRASGKWLAWAPMKSALFTADWQFHTLQCTNLKSLSLGEHLKQGVKSGRPHYFALTKAHFIYRTNMLFL